MKSSNEIKENVPKSKFDKFKRITDLQLILNKREILLRDKIFLDYSQLKNWSLCTDLMQEAKFGPYLSGENIQIYDVLTIALILIYEGKC